MHDIVHYTLTMNNTIIKQEINELVHGGWANYINTCSIAYKDALNSSESLYICTIIEM